MKTITEICKRCRWEVRGPPILKKSHAYILANETILSPMITAMLNKGVTIKNTKHQHTQSWHNYRSQKYCKSSVRRSLREIRREHADTLCTSKHSEFHETYQTKKFSLSLVLVVLATWCHRCVSTRIQISSTITKKKFRRCFCSSSWSGNLTHRSKASTRLEVDLSNERKNCFHFSEINAVLMISFLSIFSHFCWLIGIDVETSRIISSRIDCHHHILHQLDRWHAVLTSIWSYWHLSERKNTCLYSLKTDFLFFLSLFEVSACSLNEMHHHLLQHWNKWRRYCLIDWFLEDPDSHPQ